MASEVSCTKNLKSSQNESTVESTDSEERSETSVEVKAQVMKRGDAGWVPIDGGGLSVVGLSTLPPEEKVEEVQYKVNARRVKDNASLLSCILKKDLAYTKGNPLFHHWQTQGQKFGLTFHSSTDACTFEQWICNAKQTLLGSNADCEKSDQVCEDSLSRDASLATRLIKDTVSLPGSRARTPSPGASNRVNLRHSSILLSSYPSSYPALHNMRLYNKDGEAPAVRCAVPCAASGYGRKRKSKLHQRQSEERQSIWIRREDLSMPEFSNAAADSSYVQFSKSDSTKANCNNFNMVHEYFYPTLGSVEVPPQSLTSHHPELHARHSRSASASLSRTCGGLPGAASAATLVPSGSFGGGTSGNVALRLPKKCKKKKKGKSRSAKTMQRECFSVSSLSSKRSSSGNLQLHQQQQQQLHLRRRCVRCREFYIESENRSGKCPYGSDRCVRCIEAVTCANCARAILYHLAADENGDYGRLCSCSDGHHRNARKWLVLTLISIFLPCFWCYAPLEGCHRCCIRRGHCGSRHKSEL